MTSTGADDTLRDAIAFTRATIAGDRAGADVILSNTRCKDALITGMASLAMLAWSWPETPSAADLAEMDSELARFQQVVNE
jgi:hypothetical protein